MSETWAAQVWEAAKLAGPFGTLLMLFIWWRTDSERSRLLTERDQLLERMIGAMNSATDAIRENTKAIWISASGRVPPPPSQGGV